MNNEINFEFLIYLKYCGMEPPLTNCQETLCLMSHARRKGQFFRFLPPNDIYYKTQFLIKKHVWKKLHINPRSVTSIHKYSLVK